MLGEKKNHRILYLVGLITLAAVLPLSIFMISVAQFILAANWLLEGDLKKKIQRFWHNKAAVAFSSIYLLHLVGLVYSSDLDYALHDLKVKLPILILPVIIGSSLPLTTKEFKWVSFFFVLAVITGSVISMLRYVGWWGEAIHDYREVSPFISYIRFSLMTGMAFFVTLYFGLRETLLWKRIALFVVAAWLLVFLFFLKSISGVVAFLAAAVAISIYLSVIYRKRIIRYSIWFILVVGMAAVSIYLYDTVKDFYKAYDVDVSSLEQYTAHGEKYEHNLEDKQIENGNLLGLYLARNELAAAWNERSDIEFKGKDKNGFPVEWTLIRFMTSKGYRKDRKGVEQLTDEEIKAIESGIANVRYMDSRNLDDRVNEVIWEVHRYSLGVNPQGHSVSQRLEFWKTGWNIFKANLFFGVGTGDIKQAFIDQYEKSETEMEKAFWFRSHNQYLTFLITFGIAGFTWFIAAYFGPFFSDKRRADLLVLAFLLISSISMLNEDSLENQAGVTFICFFYCLFLFGRKEMGLA